MTFETLPVWCPPFRVSFSNSTTSAEAIAFTNEIQIDHDGWAQLAPFGDYPGQAMLRQSDGSIARFAAIQRLDRAAAHTMVAKFKSPPRNRPSAWATTQTISAMIAGSRPPAD